MDSKRSLSEISHLFLSEIRQRQPGNGERPRRIAPARQPEAAEDVLESVVKESLPIDPAAAKVSIVLGSHLGEQRGARVKQYARHLAATESDRVGLIEIDRNEFIVSCFEARCGEQSPTLAVVDELDERRMSEALAELSFDVDRWLISLSNPRTPEAREILGASPHWTLLTSADHDGVVATYRALKGLAELGRPKLSLAVLDAADEAQASAVFRKLDAVSRQFLGCRMEAESPVRLVGEMTEHLLLNCRGNNEHSSDAPAPQWKVIADFLSELAIPRQKPDAPRAATMKIKEPADEPIPAAPAPRPRLAAMEQTMPEVIELSPDASDQPVLDAVVRQGGADGRWVQCPIRPPACPHAVLAVDREHRLVLLAVAGRGLSELRAVGVALKWMEENRELIQMALPQLAIDATANPVVRLLVDHADLSAEVLQPLLQSERVTVQAYRMMKWGPKTGLLLEAA